MVGRFIRSAVDTIRSAPMKIEFVGDLRRSTLEPGDEIDAVVELTPKNKVAHVVEASVSIVLEFEIVRVNTIMIADGKAAIHGSHVPAVRPKTVQNRTVDTHRLDTEVILSKRALQPRKATFSVRLSVPEELPRPPASAISSVATWKLVATVRLTDGNVYSAEQVITPRG